MWRNQWAFKDLTRATAKALACFFILPILSTCGGPGETDGEVDGVVRDLGSTEQLAFAIDQDALSRLRRVTIEKPNDSVFKKPVSYVAVPFDALIRQAFPHLAKYAARGLCLKRPGFSEGSFI